MIKPIFIHREGLNETENLTLNSILRIHMEGFLSSFTMTRMDKEFSGIFDGTLMHLCPANVLLNGLDHKRYEINNKEDIDLKGPINELKR